MAATSQPSIKTGATAPIDWGQLRSTTPISRLFGTDRGTAIDRYYIDKFLDRRRQDIRGRVLEISEPCYTRRFGDDRVTTSDVLHATTGNRKATLIGDLQTGQGIPVDTYDCIILTQVLPFLFDFHAAVRTVHEALSSGGVVLATLPMISPISRYDMDRWGDYWRFTSLGARRLFEHYFQGGSVEVESFGNVLAATAFVQGLALEELTPAELDEFDPDYELIVAVRATKA